MLNLTENEKNEIIKAMALGVNFETIALLNDCTVSQINEFYKANQQEVKERILFEKEKGMV